MREGTERHARAGEDVIGSRERSRVDEPLVSPARTGTDATSPENRGEIAQTPLFSAAEADQLRTRWESVQAGFVDEPRRSVEEADGLVRTVMDRLTDGFAQQRARLEHEWGARDEISTEDLRLALRHYRSFFDRLLISDRLRSGAARWHGPGATRALVSYRHEPVILG